MGVKKSTKKGRSFVPITKADLKKLGHKSAECLLTYFLQGEGKKKWGSVCDIKKPLAVVLCQDSAMHYHDKKTGIDDFTVWFFYAYNKKPLPARATWHWDYGKSKFGNNPLDKGYIGRRVDVKVRSIKNYVKSNPVETIHKYLRYEKTRSSRDIARTAVVMLNPESLLGKTVWYKQKI